LEVLRMVEQGDVVMAELSGTAKRAAGWVIELKENDYR